MPSYHPLPMGAHEEGEDFGQWNVEYDGYGTVAVVRDETRQRVVDLQPAIDPPQAGTTAAMVKGQAETSGDVVVRARMRTLSQNATSREPAQTPKPWEVGWIMWNATTRDGPGDQGTGIPTDVTEHSYYLALKPNGWEIGKLDQALFTAGGDGGQRYLATGSSPTYPVGSQWRYVVISQIDSTIRVRVDGVTLATFTDGPGSGGYRPWTSYPAQEIYTSGALALYSEDAHVQFKDVSVKRPRK